MKKGDPPEPALLETSGGTFELSYGISVGVTEPPPHPIYLNVVVYEYRDWERQHDDLWQDDVPNVSDLIELLHQTGMPDDEAEVAARLRSAKRCGMCEKAGRTSNCWSILTTGPRPDRRVVSTGGSDARRGQCSGMSPDA